MTRQQYQDYLDALPGLTKQRKALHSLQILVATILKNISI